MAITRYMQLNKPGTGDNAPSWADAAEQQNQNAEIIDDHDHSEGKGKQISGQGIANNAITPDKLDADTDAKKQALRERIGAGDGSGATALADGAVTTAKLANGAVTAQKLHDDAVTPDHIDADTNAKKQALRERIGAAEQGASIDDGSVTTAKLADNSVTTQKLHDDAVTPDKLDADTDAKKRALRERIGAGDGSGLADGSIATAKLANGAVTEPKIADGAVVTGKLANEAVTGQKIAAGTIAGSKLTDSTVPSSKIAQNAVITSKIVNAAVTGEKIADGAVTQTKLANGVATEQHLANNSVTTQKIANGAVTEPKIADGAVTANKIGNGAVATNKIADGSVTSGKIAANAVTNAKLSGNSVGTSKIIDSNVTSSKLAVDSVTTPKIANNAITSAKVSDDAITPGKLDADTDAKKTSFRERIGVEDSASLDLDSAADENKDIDFVVGEISPAGPTGRTFGFDVIDNEFFSIGFNNDVNTLIFYRDQAASNIRRTFGISGLLNGQAVKAINVDGIDHPLTNGRSAPFEANYTQAQLRALVIDFLLADGTYAYGHAQSKTQKVTSVSEVKRRLGVIDFDGDEADIAATLKVPVQQSRRGIISEVVTDVLHSSDGAVVYPEQETMIEANNAFVTIYDRATGINRLGGGNDRGNNRGIEKVEVSLGSLSTRGRVTLSESAWNEIYDASTASKLKAPYTQVGNGLTYRGANLASIINNRAVLGYALDPNTRQLIFRAVNANLAGTITYPKRWNILRVPNLRNATATEGYWVYSPFNGGTTVTAPANVSYHAQPVDIFNTSGNVGHKTGDSENRITRLRKAAPRASGGIRYADLEYTFSAAAWAEIYDADTSNKLKSPWTTLWYNNVQLVYAGNALPTVSPYVYRYIFDAANRKITFNVGASSSGVANFITSGQRLNLSIENDTGTIKLLGAVVGDIVNSKILSGTTAKRWLDNIPDSLETSEARSYEGVGSRETFSQGANYIAQSPNASPFSAIGVPAGANRCLVNFVFRQTGSQTGTARLFYRLAGVDYALFRLGVPVDLENGEETQLNLSANHFDNGFLRLSVKEASLQNLQGVFTITYQFYKADNSSLGEVKEIVIPSTTSHLLTRNEHSIGRANAVQGTINFSQGFDLYEFDELEVMNHMINGSLNDGQQAIRRIYTRGMIEEAGTLNLQNASHITDFKTNRRARIVHHGWLDRVRETLIHVNNDKLDAIIAGGNYPVNCDAFRQNGARITGIEYLFYADGATSWNMGTATVKLRR